MNRNGAFFNGASTVLWLTYYFRTEGTLSFFFYLLVWVSLCMKLWMLPYLLTKMLASLFCLHSFLSLCNSREIKVKVSTTGFSGQITSFKSLGLERASTTWACSQCFKLPHFLPCFSVVSQHHIWGWEDHFVNPPREGQGFSFTKKCKNFIFWQF